LLGGLTLLLDAAKGTAAVMLSYVVADHREAIPTLEQAALGALFAVLGHVFPVWLKFRGGKGVATGLGAFALLAPKAILVAVGFFIVVVLITRYVSLGSITAVAVFPLAAGLIRQFYLSPVALALMSVASLLILIKHRDNMRRLWAGTESRLGANRA
jgi:glycerol-3-phosphate acyltransferase PlsY